MEEQNRIASIAAKNTRDAFDKSFWPAFQAALAQGLTERQIEAAMSAAKAEQTKWTGARDWGDAVAAIVAAAFRAAASGER